MRYLSVPDVTFTAPDGRRVVIKDVRPRPGRAASSLSVSVQDGAQLDEVATRDSCFGEGYESLAYRLFEENDVEIVERGFSAPNVLRVPL